MEQDRRCTETGLPWHPDAVSQDWIPQFMAPRELVLFGQMTASVVE
jgi:hypothetical protein